MAPRRRPDGIAVLVTGSRGSGKSGWTRQQCEAAPRLLVWDSVHEWSRDRVVTPVRSLPELHDLVVADLRTPGPFRYGYTGRVNGNTFETFCKLAFVWMKARGDGTLVVEELADVTSPAKAPEGWGDIIRKGRHYGGRIYALTQRPAESDKTIAGNADVIHTGRLSFPRDRKTMAEYLDVPVEEITALESLHWIERDMRDRRLTRGVLGFSRPRRSR
ncbi:MAG: hypothetical protein ACREU6_09910 [Steroidobacteraceae bacterium]